MSLALSRNALAHDALCTWLTVGIAPNCAHRKTRHLAGIGPNFARRASNSPSHLAISIITQMIILYPQCDQAFSELSDHEVILSSAWFLHRTHWSATIISPLINRGNHYQSLLLSDLLVHWCALITSHEPLVDYTPVKARNIEHTRNARSNESPMSAQGFRGVINKRMPRIPDN